MVRRPYRSYQGREQVSIKPLTTDTVKLINQECLTWLTLQTKLRQEDMYSDRWFAIKRERDAVWSLIKNMTGLNNRQVDDLIYNKTNTMTYWHPNGKIRTSK